MTIPELSVFRQPSGKRESHDRAANEPEVTERRRPVNLRPGELRLFANALRGCSPPTQVTRLHGVEAFGRGPLRKAGNYLVESFADPLHLQTWIRRRGHWRAALERMLAPVHRIDRPVVWITDNWSCGYYHWMCDALPRLENAVAHYSASELTLLLPAKFRRASYFRSSLQAFGLRQVRILNRFERVCCSEFLLPSRLGTTGNYDGPLMQSLGARLRHHVASPPSNDVQGALGKTPDRLYISRSLAGRRRIANEAEILPVFKKHGFITCFAERTPWRRQIELANGASVLVSNHGAGLSNMLAMEPEHSVLEIRERGDDYNNCYFTLASSARLRYHYLLADKQDPRHSVHKANLVVDPERLDATLDEMLAESRRRCA